MAMLYISAALAFLFDNELLTHGALIVGDAIATIVVGWGILWESPRQPESRHRIAMWLVICGVGLETICSLSLFAYDEGISQNQQAKIIALENENQTLTGNLRNLDLQTGWRKPAQDEITKLLEEGPSAPVEVLYLKDDPECFELAQTIRQALDAAGWPASGPSPFPEQENSDLPSATMMDANPSGVTVVSSPITKAESDASDAQMLGKPWVKTPFTVLSNALLQTVGKLHTSSGGPHAPPPSKLRVVVAPRG